MRKEKLREEIRKSRKNKNTILMYKKKKTLKGKHFNQSSTF